MEFKDVLGVGKVAEKLIEVVSKGCGKVTNSYFIKKDAAAKAEALRTISHAEIDIERSKTISEAHSKGISQKIDSNTKGEIEIIKFNNRNLVNEINNNQSFADRTNSRINYSEVKAQLNIESIVAAAHESLKEDLTDNNSKVDEDWIHTFFEYSKSISSEKIQQLWGKILAGEITEPSKYSLRTLAILKSISTSESMIFQKICKVAFQNNLGAYIPEDDKFLQSCNISYTDKILLCEIGLLHPKPSTLSNLPASLENIESLELINNHSLHIHYNSHPGYKWTVNMFTRAGTELITLIEETPAEELLTWLVEKHQFCKSVTLMKKEENTLNNGHIYTPIRELKG